jgi:chemotaxis protein MotB
MAVVAVAFFVVGGSGCATSKMKDENRRLKESNDRLISENNRLEEELAALQKRLGDGQEALAQPAPAVATLADPATVPATKSALEDELLLDDPDVKVIQEGNETRITVPDRVFFALGQANLTSRGQAILKRVAKLINTTYRNRLVRVDGHTDDTPIRKVKGRYPTNWELSTARAVTVVRYLVEGCDVNAHRIYPAGFSYYRPVSNGRTASAKGQNRRVEIVVLEDRA